MAPFTSQWYEKSGGRSLDDIIGDSSSDQLDEILAISSDLVPTGKKLRRDPDPSPKIAVISESLAAAEAEASLSNASDGQLDARPNPRTVANPESEPETSVNWQKAMKLAIRSTSELRDRLGLPPVATKDAEVDFPTFVPLEYLSRIQPGCPEDPLLRQVAADPRESSVVDGFTSDPVGDLASLASGGVIHKYHGRALLITTGACGVHCRYCFRREFPYDSVNTQRDQTDASIDYLRKNESIEEVILSGGDPLTVVDSKLDLLITRIESIQHIKRLRIHTRMPIVIPQRVTDGLVSRLRISRLAVWIVVHANHVNELDASVLQHLAKLVDAGIPVLNQAVLLRGVNDSVKALADLCGELVNYRVQPYYLHQLDRVHGASHFEVPVADGLALIQQLRNQLPGYAVPQYVSEISGEPAKTIV